ncbi:MAG: hypothetical protein Ct9H300mP11_20160 [Chloroflexota bacterium]|nr:MAG: hypothetical protein Ct9H300mP11_20160 [Chloroflexota bacterium]
MERALSPYATMVLLLLVRCHFGWVFRVLWSGSMLKTDFRSCLTGQDVTDVIEGGFNIIWNRGRGLSDHLRRIN